MSKDLVADAIDEVTQRREDAWALMKRMHDEANGEVFLQAALGWCAPSQATYSMVPIAITSDQGLIDLNKVVVPKGVRFP